MQVMVACRRLMKLNLAFECDADEADFDDRDWTAFAGWLVWIT
jgi:hypothetical protein